MIRSQDIDNGMVRGCTHPMGPLQLADLIGLDTSRSPRALNAGFKEPLFSPPTMPLRMADAGLLGRKSGRAYDDDTSRAGRPLTSTTAPARSRTSLCCCGN